MSDSITEKNPFFIGGGGDNSLQLINQGAYGCIYHPGINCQGKRESKTFITKIQKSERTNENEIGISTMIRKIKGYLRYFSPVIKQCPVKIQKKYSDEIRQCELFENMNTQDIQKSSYVSNKIRYVGKYTLLKHIMRQPDVDKLAKEIFSTHLYLLKALDILNKHDIVHFDLKYNNIMFDDKIKHPIIIDFGLSMHIPSIRASTIDDRFYVFEAYSYWSFEIHILNYICQVIQIDRTKSLHFAKEDIPMLIGTFMYGSDYVEGGMNHFKNDIFNNSIVASKDIEKYTHSLAQYMNKYVGKTWHELYESMIKTHTTWDGYSLAVIYLFILDDLHTKEQGLYSDMLSKYRGNFEKYRRFLADIIYTMPGERMSLEQMKTALTKLAK